VNSQFVLTAGQQAMVMLLTVSAPLLAVVLVVGLVVSVVQAITQIHEATLAFVPKLLAAIAVLVIAGPWMLATLVDYVRRSLQAIPSLVL
jgi:flagellar biosynthetic protein FliQ